VFAGSHLGFPRPYIAEGASIDPQRRIVVGSRFFRLAQLEVDKARCRALVEVAGRSSKLRRNPFRAVCKLADHEYAPSSDGSTLDIFGV